MKRLLAIGVVAIGLVLSGCGGDDDETTSSTAPSEGLQPPGGSAPPGADVGALPPAFIECMADEGYEVESADDVHSAPQQVLQMCFGSIHQ